jgi:hypothetical protein
VLSVVGFIIKVSMYIVSGRQEELIYENLSGKQFYIAIAIKAPFQLNAGLRSRNQLVCIKLNQLQMALILL